MNRQEVFNTVKEHLLRQGTRSIWHYSSSTCLYRGPEGRKCAIGCLIPDEYYQPSMEGIAIDSFRGEFDYVLSYLGVNCDDDIEFLQDLQNVHDSYHPDDWATALERFVLRRWVQPVKEEEL